MPGMRYLLRPLLLLGLLASVGIAVPASAARCQAHCQETARSCRARCSIGTPSSGGNSDCLNSCNKAEQACTANCR
jgi:hypothetical protein